MSSADKELNILVVEDSEDDLLLLSHEIKRGGYSASYKRVETEAEMRTALGQNTWNLIIADYTMPHFSGVEALQVLADTGLDIPLIVVSGTITDETAVLAMRSGAKDYLMKDDLRRLVPVMEREISETQERSERRRVQEHLRQQEKENERLERQAEAATERFLRDTVFAVTDGRLNLISDDEGECLCPTGPLLMKFTDASQIGSIRAAVKAAALEMGIDEDRTHALVTAAGEAVVNALKHAHGGCMSIHRLDDRIRIGIRDCGKGIESLILPTATLMTRFSTAHSMGFGFALMLGSVDTVYLATGKHGTWIILEQDTVPENPEITLSELPDVW